MSTQSLFSYLFIILKKFGRKVPIFLLAICVVSVTDLAWASPPAAPAGNLGGVTEFLPDAKAMLAYMVDLIYNKAQLPELMQSIGYALLLLGIVWTGLNIAQVGAPSERVGGFLLRVIVAGALIASSIELGKQLVTFQVESYNWSLQKFAAPVLADAGVQSKNLMMHTGVLAGTVALVATGGTAGVAALGANAGAVASAAGSAALTTGVKAGAGILGASQWLLLASAPIYLVLNLIGLITSLTVLFSAIFLPLICGALVFERGPAESWVGAWFKATTGAWFIALFVPLVFAAALQVSLVGPSTRYNTELARIETEQTAALNAANAEIELKYKDASGSMVPNVGVEVSKAANKAGAQLGSMFSGWMQNLGALIMSILMALIGVLTGVVLVNNAQAQISQFVGGLITRNQSPPGGRGFKIPKVNDIKLKFGGGGTNDGPGPTPDRTSAIHGSGPRADTPQRALPAGSSSPALSGSSGPALSGAKYDMDAEVIDVEVISSSPAQRSLPAGR